MPTATLREKTQEVRRAHILEAAAAVFAERGYHRATIKDVARAAGISDGAIYNVFENKAALLLGLLDPLGATAQPDLLSPAGNGEPGVILEALIRQRWAAFSPAMLRRLRSVLSEALVDEDLQRRFFERVIAPVLGAQSATNQQQANALRLMVGAMIGLIMLRLLGDEETSAQWDVLPKLLADVFASQIVRAGDPA